MYLKMSMHTVQSSVGRLKLQTPYVAYPPYLQLPRKTDTHFGFYCGKILEVDYQSQSSPVAHVSQY